MTSFPQASHLIHEHQVCFCSFTLGGRPIHSHQLLRVGDYGHYTRQIDPINTSRLCTVDLVDKKIWILGVGTKVLALWASLLHRLHRLGDRERLTAVRRQPLVRDGRLDKVCGESVCQYTLDGGKDPGFRCAFGRYILPARHALTHAWLSSKPRSSFSQKYRVPAWARPSGSLG